MKQAASAQLSMSTHSIIAGQDRRGVTARYFIHG